MQRRSGNTGILTYDLEEKLVIRILDMEARFYELTNYDILRAFIMLANKLKWNTGLVQRSS